MRDRESSWARRRRRSARVRDGDGEEEDNLVVWGALWIIVDEMDRIGAK